MPSNDFAPDFLNILIGTITSYVSFLDVQHMFFIKENEFFTHSNKILWPKIIYYLKETMTFKADFCFKAPRVSLHTNVNHMTAQ